MKQKYYTILLLILLIFTVLLIFNKFQGENYEKDQFAFITSSYYYPSSESLGQNALALVLTMNLLVKMQENETMDYFDRFKTNEIVIFAENSTNEITVKAPLEKVSGDTGCRMIIRFATAQLIPNVKRISLISGNDKTVIPFSTPNRRKRDVVFCISPLFVTENWQNFLFAVHIYKHFGAHTHLYLSSAVNSFYSLMQEYEIADYVTLQPWTPIDFPGVGKEDLDWAEDIAFRNQPASQTDCLLQYKESASFVGLLDFDDILIPKIAPTYIQEFQHFMSTDDTNAYLFYDKQNYNIKSVNEASKFSITEMLKSLEFKSENEMGKMVTPPGNINSSWIHNPGRIQHGKKEYVVRDNTITHLKEITIDLNVKTSRNLNLPKYMNTSELLISQNDIELIEKDLKRMFHKHQVKDLLSTLPKDQFYGDTIRKCYHDKYYNLFKTGQTDKVVCTGPFLCEYEQRDDIKCVHVNATYQPMPRLQPITFYFSTNPYFSQDMGCYP